MKYMNYAVLGYWGKLQKGFPEQTVFLKLQLLRKGFEFSQTAVLQGPHYMPQAMSGFEAYLEAMTYLRKQKPATFPPESTGFSKEWDLEPQQVSIPGLIPGPLVQCRCRTEKLKWGLCTSGLWETAHSHSPGACLGFIRQPLGNHPDVGT